MIHPSSGGVPKGPSRGRASVSQAIIIAIAALAAASVAVFLRRTSQRVGWHGNESQLLKGTRRNITRVVTTDSLDDVDIDVDARAVNELLSNVLAIVAYWHSGPTDEFSYFSHTVGALADWRLYVGNLTIVVITNDRDGVYNSIGEGLRDVIELRQINSSTSEGYSHGYHMPHFHRQIVAEKLNHVNENPPTAFAFFESDTSASAEALLGWAKDVIFLKANAPNFTRHFFRWEFNKKKQCVAMNGQVNPVERQKQVHLIGGRRFLSLDEGKMAGMYIVTLEMMTKFYRSGSFWTMDREPKSTRENQVLSVTKANFSYWYPLGGWNVHDEHVVPMKGQDELDMIAGVHHQSDKYARLPWPFGKLCVQDLF
ncbi:hypothetical protein ACHAWF_001580 [Thalassiosira exigua]